MATQNRRLDDVLTRRQVLIQKLSTGEAQKFARFLREIDREIRARLSGSELTEFSRKRLEVLLDDVSSTLAEIFGRFADTVTDSAEAIAANEAEFSRKAIDVVVDVESALPSNSQIRAAVFSNPLSVSRPGGGKLLKDFIKDWTEAEVKAVTGAIRRGVFEGQTNAEIVRAIRGTKAKRFADGLLDTTSRHARGVVQTAVQHVAAQARLETFNENSDIVKGVQWLSTLDNRTCVACAALDLKEFPNDKGPRPPLHVNCRCTVTAVLVDQFAALNERTVRPSVGPEGAKQTSAGISYYEWLRQQPAEFQNMAIGPKRAQLLRDGGLSADRFAQLMLDKNFEPITLDEMKLLEPLAFKEAGL